MRHVKHTGITLAIGDAIKFYGLLINYPYEERASKSYFQFMYTNRVRNVCGISSFKYPDTLWRL